MPLSDWIQAAQTGDLDYIKEYLEEYKGKTTGAGLTALMLAASNHHPHIVAVLASLEHGAYDSDGNTALALAAASDDEESCAVLLNWEKDLVLPGGRNPLMVCIANGGTRALPLLLDVYGQGCDALGRTVLEYSIVSKQPRTMCIVLDYTRPSFLEISSSVVKTYSSLETILTELQNTATRLAAEKQQIYQQLKETETELDTANLGCHNLRCKIRSMEDYTDSIHELLRQITKIESIDDILSRLIDPVFNAEILTYFKANKMESTINVSTSPLNDILSCSPAELRCTQLDISFNEELERLKEQLVDKDKVILALTEKLNNNQVANCTVNDCSEYSRLMEKTYMQQISEQKARIDKQEEELRALRHLVGSMAIESIADSPKETSQHTTEQEILLVAAKEERLNAIKQLRTTPEESCIYTIKEQQMQDISNQFNCSLSNTFISDKEMIRMYRVMEDLLKADVAAQSMKNNARCGAETLSPLRLFTETADNSINTLIDVTVDEFKIVLDRLIKQFINMHNEKIDIIDTYNNYGSDEPADKDIRSNDWKSIHNHFNCAGNKIDESSENQYIDCKIDNTVAPMVTQSLKSSSPPQLLSSSNKCYSELSEKSHQFDIDISDGSNAKEEDDVIQNTDMTNRTEDSLPRQLMKAPIRTINVQKEDEELLRYMLSPKDLSNSGKVSKNRSLDVSTTYNVLNEQCRRHIQANHGNTTVVSAMITSHGIQIKTSKGRTF